MFGLELEILQGTVQWHLVKSLISLTKNKTECTDYTLYREGCTIAEQEKRWLSLWLVNV